MQFFRCKKKKAADFSEKEKEKKKKKCFFVIDATHLAPNGKQLATGGKTEVTKEPEKKKKLKGK